MTHVTCGLTAKHRDQLRNPTFGNRVWATFLRVHVDHSNCQRTLSHATYSQHGSIRYSEISKPISNGKSTMIARFGEGLMKLYADENTLELRAF